MSFTKNIRPHVEKHIELAYLARQKKDPATEFKHLENAHVLGQHSTYWHVKTHLLMLTWALRNNAPREFAGQILRVIGAATKTGLGWVPTGNTGGANISPFKPLPVPAEFEHLIAQAKRR